MSVKEVSLYFLGGVPIQYFGLDPINPSTQSIKSQKSHKSELKILLSVVLICEQSEARLGGDK